jgi:16S rRNA (cytosine967-C5)-methyltransferase
VTPRATAPRAAALAALRRLRAGDLLDRAVESAFAPLDPRERAWAHELTYGTVRLRGRIDFMLQALVRGGLDALEPDVLDVLRLGAYQILEMGSVPDYAAVSQSRELVREAGAPRAAGLVAGVLHALGRRRAEIVLPDAEHDPVGHLAVVGSHPVWLVERWVARWGVDGARALVEANNRIPEAYLRPIGLARDEAASRLAEAGIETEPVALSPRSLRLLPPATAVGALAVVPGVMQDPAASLVVDYAAAPAGARVADLCAAPGGKALGLAERASLVLALDRSRTRLARVRDNVARLGRGAQVIAVNADARVPPVAPASVDLVLLDAPCTGTGTLRRHPDGRWRLRPRDLESLIALQAELLGAAANCVRPGGWLVYSTCSVEEEENEVQVQRFLDSRPGWRLDPVPGVADRAVIDDRGQLVVLPHRHGVDGAFAARMRRVT